MEIGGENFLFKRLFLFYRKNDENDENGGKKSFLAIDNQKLHTDSLDAVDQRRARLVSI